MKIKLSGVFTAPKKENCVIESTERCGDGSPSFFVTWHGYTPFYSREAKKGKVFTSCSEAGSYALEELFDKESAFRIVML